MDESVCYVEISGVSWMIGYIMNMNSMKLKMEILFHENKDTNYKSYIICYYNNTCSLHMFGTRRRSLLTQKVTQKYATDINLK